MFCGRLMCSDAKEVKKKRTPSIFDLNPLSSLTPPVFVGTLVQLTCALFLNHPFMHLNRLKDSESDTGKRKMKEKTATHIFISNFVMHNLDIELPWKHDSYVIHKQWELCSSFF